MNTAEAARALGLTVGRVGQLIREGHLCTVKVGGRWQVSRLSLERFQQGGSLKRIERLTAQLKRRYKIGTDYE